MIGWYFEYFENIHMHSSLVFSLFGSSRQVARAGVLELGRQSLARRPRSSCLGQRCGRRPHVGLLTADAPRPHGPGHGAQSCGGGCETQGEESG